MNHWTYRLRAGLKRKGLTFEDLAQHVGVSRSAIGHYLRGTRQPSLAQIQSMCALAGISVSEALGDSEPITLQADERVLIERFRSLDGQQRKAVSSIVEQLSRASLIIERGR